MRNVSTTLAAIFAAPERKVDYSIDIIFPDSTSLKFATLPVEKSKGTYTNDLESVGELRQTIESPTDKVKIAIQNKDKVLGVHLAQYWQQWRRAEAIIERLYRDKTGTLSEWVEFFRGAIQQPNASDLQVSFEIISDVLSPGLIVASRTLALPCPFIFKDDKTCGYSGALTTCNRLLKSADGCDGRANSHHFGGTETRYQPEISVPGTGGNTGGTDGGGRPQPPRPCPRIDQYVLTRGDHNRPTPKMCGFLTEEDYLWHPSHNAFYKIKYVELVKNVRIDEFVAGNGAVGFSSEGHRIIADKTDEKGKPVKNYRPKDSALTVIENQMHDSFCVLAQNTGKSGDVIRIEMEEGHLYCYGDSTEKFIVCHNWKLPED